MAKKKTTLVTITYCGEGIYTYDGGQGVLRPGEAAQVPMPLADHWRVLLEAGKATLA